MIVNLRGVAVAAFCLLIAVRASAQGDSGSVPVTGFLFPGESINIFIPEPPDMEHRKILTFEGNIQNTTPVPTFMEFWFDWFDGSTIVTTTPQIFELSPTLGPPPFGYIFFGTPLATQPALTHTIPYCPPEVSIHWRNTGPGGPVSVSGVFSWECVVPEPFTLVILPVIVVMGPLVLRKMKALAAA
jgi:hypothetical protein